MEGSCSTGQSPQRAVVPVEEEAANTIRVELIVLAASQRARMINTVRGIYSNCLLMMNS
jgi:hypothetical protein